MKQTNAPRMTPSPQPGVAKPQNAVGKTRGLGLTFAAAALDMSWRLVIVVLVPIVGGYWLDKHFKTTPTFIIIGFIVAMAGLYAVLKQTLDMADEKFIRGDKNRPGDKEAKR